MNFGNIYETLQFRYLPWSLKILFYLLIAKSIALKQEIWQLNRLYPSLNEMLIRQKLK